MVKIHTAEATAEAAAAPPAATPAAAPAATSSKKSIVEFELFAKSSYSTTLLKIPILPHGLS